METQHEFRGGQSQLGPVGVAELPFEPIQPSEEGFNLSKKFAARGSQAKGRPLEKANPKIRLQGRHLPTDGWLLNAIRDMPNGRANPLMLGHVIE